jgi:hypothetical protein
MELQTLFKRESVADPFFIRIMQIIPSSVPILIMAYPLFHTRIPTWRAGKPVSTELSVKKWRCLKPRKNIPSLPPAFDMYLVLILLFLINVTVLYSVLEFLNNLWGLGTQ